MVRDLFILLAVFNFGFYTRIVAQELEYSNVKIPCIDWSRNTKKNYRELGSGVDADYALARKAAIKDALNNIKLKLGGVVQGFSSDYITVTDGEIKTLDSLEITTVVNTVLNDARTECEGQGKDTKGNYHVFVALSIKKNNLKKGLKKQVRNESSYFKERYNTYLSLGFGNGVTYGKVVGASFQGRHGGTIGFGYLVGIGLGGHRLKQVSSTSYDNTSGTSSYDEELLNFYLHYSFGLKLFFYRSAYFSAQYGTITEGVVSTYNENSEWKTDGIKVIKGISYTVGTDYFLDEDTFLTFGAGVSQLEDNSLITAWNIGIAYRLFQ